MLHRQFNFFHRSWELSRGHQAFNWIGEVHGRYGLRAEPGCPTLRSLALLTRGGSGISPAAAATWLRPEALARKSAASAFRIEAARSLLRRGATPMLAVNSTAWPSSSTTCAATAARSRS